MGCCRIADSSESNCQQVAADLFESDFDTGPAAMFYLKQPLDDGNRSSQHASYGFRVDYSTRIANSDGSGMFRPTLLDVRLQQGQLQSLEFHGVPVGLRDPQTNEFTWGDKEYSNGYLLVGALGVLGILCATENVICEDDDDDAGSTPEAPAPAQANNRLREWLRNRNENQNQGG